MGCGGSKHEAAGNELIVHAKVKPLLRRRLEEIRRRRTANTSKDNNTLSRKELLKDGASDDTSSASHRPHEDDTKSISFGEDNNKLRKVAPEPTESDFSDEPVVKDIEVDTSVESPVAVHKKVAKKESESSENVVPQSTKPATSLEPEEEEEEETRELCVELDDDKKECDKVVKVIPEGDVVETTDETENNTDVEEDGRHISLNNALDCPGSPSFRVYYVESLDGTKDDEDINAEERNDHTEKTEEVGSNTVQTVIPDEETNKKVRKGKKGGKFRKVMQVSKGTGAVKNLLNVNIRSCYNPARSAQDKDHLLSGKTVA